MNQIALLYHSYYPVIAADIDPELLTFMARSTVFITGSKDNFANYKNAKLVQVPNQGKDIGGKLAMLDLCLRLKIKVDYYVFLHDKQSPHTTFGDDWRKKLFRIISSENVEKIIGLFQKNEKVGIVAAHQFINNEYDHTTGNFNCTSNELLKKLIKTYNLKLNNFDFIGGTMFWIRACIIEKFFTEHHPLKIRATLEKGNVLDIESGTNTHAWERMLSWVATDQGFQIKGI